MLNDFREQLSDVVHLLAPLVYLTRGEARRLSDSLRLSLLAVTMIIETRD